MSEWGVVKDGAFVPTFSACGLGYRVWGLDDDGELWPLAKRRVPWDVGINTARCNCETSDRLHFAWSVVGGQRRLEPAPLHHAPAEMCRCGLYSLRRPKAAWAEDPRLRSGQHVAGAVASWWRLQVHATGARAEHACVLALALVPDVESAAAARVERAARHYGVEAVPLADLVTAGARHAQPLPDAVHDAADGPDNTGDTGQPVPVEDLHPARPRRIAGATSPAADASEDDLDDPLRRARPGAPLARHAILALAVVTALVLVLIALDHHPSGCHIINPGSYGERAVCPHNPPGH